jgi:hypothetical protein
MPTRRQLAPPNNNRLRLTTDKFTFMGDFIRDILSQYHHYSPKFSRSSPLPARSVAYALSQGKLRGSARLAQIPFGRLRSFRAGSSQPKTRYSGLQENCAALVYLPISLAVESHLQQPVLGIVPLPTSGTDEIPAPICALTIEIRGHGKRCAATARDEKHAERRDASATAGETPALPFETRVRRAFMILLRLRADVSCACLPARFSCAGAGSHALVDRIARARQSVDGDAGDQAGIRAPFAGAAAPGRASTTVGALAWAGGAGPCVAAPVLRLRGVLGAEASGETAYMHRNPVKRGLVLEPEQWVWNSYRHYAYGEAGRVVVNEPQRAELRVRKIS